MIEAVGGRKFIFGLLLLVAGFVFTLLEMATVEQFFSYAEVIGITYVIGNVGNSLAEAIK